MMSDEKTIEGLVLIKSLNGVKWIDPADIEALEADQKRLEWLLEYEYNVYESGAGDFYIHDGGEALMQNPKNYNCGWHTAREAINAAMKETENADPR